MSRRVFFSFHYANDIWRVNVVRNHATTKAGVEESGYWDHSLWEETKARGDAALKTLIANGMTNTSVTIVLNGSQTGIRRWVRYEMAKSFERGNGLLVVNIASIKDSAQRTSTQGPNPFAGLRFTVSADGKSTTIEQYTVNGWQPYLNIASPSNYSLRAFQSGTLDQFTRSYDWLANDGYNNFSTWVESAARAAGRQ